jgi:exopolysaccharide production protein ExoQ
MPSQLALLIGLAFVYYSFRVTRKSDGRSARDLLLPTLWYMAVSSHMLGFWLATWGIPVPGSDGNINDGSLIDALFFLALTIFGFVALSRRHFSWGAALRHNPTVTALFVFMAVSILWSQYPYVSFKRYIKIVGSVTMAFVILSGDNPMESIFTVLRRVLYIHLPMSIICIKYFREIGVEFDWSGKSFAWKGIATSKNDLGQVAMLGVIYFSWILFQRWHERGWKNIQTVYLLMALYLLKGSEYAISVTSLSTCLFALFVLVRLRTLRGRPQVARRFVRVIFFGTVTLVALILAHSIVMFSDGSMFGKIITAFGRDITLTDRTYIWHDIYEVASRNRLLGVGFGGFWIARFANIPWNENMTWVLGQGHNGYIDTYLQIGLIGSALLAIMLWSTVPRLLAQFEHDFDFTCFRISLFLTMLFVNVTETTFLRGDHHLWFIMQLLIWLLPSRPAADRDSQATQLHDTIDVNTRELPEIVVTR